MNPDKPAKQLTAIIVDDELHGRENLRMILENYCPEIRVTGLAASVSEAVTLADQLSPQIVFLDINMPVLDGFDFLDLMPRRNFLTVFVTAYSEFGINAVKAGAADYLLKPIDIRELKKTVRKLPDLLAPAAETNGSVLKDKLIIPDTHGFTILEVNDIIRFEAEGSYSIVFTKEGKKTVVSRSLSDFEKSLPDGLFCRVHRSSLINLDYVKEYSVIDGGTVTMTDGARIEVSRRKTADFMNMIRKRLRSV
ncbi:MAG: LytTR family DNA-binding domain-containing protein [Ignavibacteriaceae bacterium]|nr:LytTR family DNA-binding domain-containing protein [Ignavibacteriaceae bacterium]